MGLLNKIKAAFRPPPFTKDISGERLYEHLKNMDIGAEIMSTASSYELRPVLRWFSRRSLNYSFSIRLKGLNIDVIQINKYEIEYGDEDSSYFQYYYQIDYIVTGFEKEKWHLKRKLKKVKHSIPFILSTSVLIDGFLIKQKKVKVSTDKENACVRIHRPELKCPGCQEERIVEEDGKRVRYVFLKNAYFPSRDILEGYNEIALHVRGILRSG